MTISLLHYNPETGLAASLTATGGVSVGGYVNHSWRGLGACATQGLYTNPWYPQYVKDALKEGKTSQQIIEQLKEQDSGFEERQCLVIDKSGTALSLDGEKNIPLIGSHCFPHFAVAGNMLANQDVLTIMVNKFAMAVLVNPDDVLQNKAEPIYQQDYQDTLAQTLIDTLEKTLEAGGDKRGTYSASLRIESVNKAPIDIRVDWSEKDLITDMRKILDQVNGLSFQSFLSQLPNK